MKKGLFISIYFILSIIGVSYTFSLFNLQITFAVIILTQIIGGIIFLVLKINTVPKYSLLISPLILLFFISVFVNFSNGSFDLKYWKFWSRIEGFQIICASTIFLISNKYWKKNRIWYLVVFVFFSSIATALVFANKLSLERKISSQDFSQISLIKSNKDTIDFVSNKKHKLLIFWNTKCGFCKQEIECLKSEFYTNYDNRIELFFVNDRKDSFEEFCQYLNKKQLDLDKNYYYANTFKGLEGLTNHGVPETILLNENNVFVAQWSGFKKANCSSLLDEIKQNLPK